VIRGLRAGRGREPERGRCRHDNSRDEAHEHAAAAAGEPHAWPAPRTAEHPGTRRTNPQFTVLRLVGKRSTGTQLAGDSSMGT
jgi:hypothetical protein